MVLVPAGMKATNTLVMISAAAVTTREDALKPSGDGLVRRRRRCT